MDFIIPEKAAAFARHYEPADFQDFSTETFNEGRLRDYFKADVCPCGDPLKVYMELLKDLGFYMITTIQGEPAIVVHERFTDLKPQAKK